MEAAPRLPMISFELKISTEPVSFAAKLKQYIATFYREDPEAYNNEIHQLEQLRGTAVRPSTDVAGVQSLKKYYCQLKFLRSRFPMEKGAPCAIQFSWKDTYAGVVCSASDIDLELMSVLYNIGALHSQLGAMDSRQTPEGMKMACTHFQCAAWAFKEAREVYPQAVAASLAHEVLHFMEIVCLAQAQECILEKSMSDSRKCTIIAKVAAQAGTYYDQSGQVLSCQPEGAASEVTDIIGSRVVKDWCRYIKFKAAYQYCISLLYHGQHCEEQQKMGERCTLYQAAADKLEEARKLASNRLSGIMHSPTTAQSEIEEALGFTLDVVEGKRKAAKNENEFIYHESVPDLDTIPPLQCASLVRPIPFGANDPDVSGPDIFARLVPMEAHEASSIYSERKAELLRRTGAVVEERDRELEEFMSSLHQVDILLERLHQPQIIPQEIVDRAAALNARPEAVKALVDAMAKLSSVHLDVDSLLNEAQSLIEAEKEASLAADGRQVVSMPINDLSREAAKYKEALSKASESNEALHRAMSAHIANLKVLAQPLATVDKHLPRVTLSDEDRPALDELRKLIDKVDEMRQQRMTLFTQFKEATLSDDITSRLARNRDCSPAELDALFERELAKHLPQLALIEQNLSAQQNILLALTDAYAKLSGCRKIIVDAFRRRDQIITALIASYDAYEDLLAKANKGIDFYQKLETNVNKLLQRLRSTCRVQEEEREQKSARVTIQNPPIQNTVTPAAPKLRDYLQQPVGVRPAPLGSEHTDISKHIDLRNPLYANQYANISNGTNYQNPAQYQVPRVSTPQNYPPNSIPINYQAIPSSIGQAQNYQVSSPLNVSSPINQPPMSFSKPQNEQGPQVTPAMPPYQVVPQQYGQNINNSQTIQNYQQYYSQGKNPNYSQYQIPQSPTTQNYQVRSNTPQNYQYGMGYPNVVPPTTQDSQGKSLGQYPGGQNLNPQGKVEYQTPQPSISPNQNISYPNSQNYGQYPQGTSSIGVSQQNPVVSQGTIPNTIPQSGPAQNMQDTMLRQYPTGSVQNSNYPTQFVGGQYPKMKSSTGYQNIQMNPGMMQYPNTTIAGPQQSGTLPGYSTGIGPLDQKTQLPVIQNNQVPGSAFQQYSNAGTSQVRPNIPQYPQNNPGQNITPHLGQYPTQMSPGIGQNPQLTPAMQNMKINSNAVYPGSQMNSGTVQYPNAGISQPTNQYNSQINSGVSQYPTSGSNAASPQHQNNASPQNYAKTPSNVTSPQHYSVPQSGVTHQSGVLPPNQQIRPTSPYVNYSNQNQNYPSGYQVNTNVQNPGPGQYQQGQVKGVYQQPGSAFYQPQPNNQIYATPNQNLGYRPQSPYQYPNQVQPNVDTSKIPPQGTYYPNTTPQNVTQTVPVAPIRKDSNIDLLAGLDFNVTQVPLDPVKAPLNESKNEIKDPEKEASTTQQIEPPKEQKNEVKSNQNPDRWKKERSFELDVTKLDNWVTNNLDHEIESHWKNLQKENDIANAIISVARCYPGRNRCPDSLPYDHNRFELPCPPATDDYINASKAQLSNLPPIILTQTPLPTTVEHFWTMVAHSGAELVICLMTDTELRNSGLTEGYWQPEYGIQLRSTQIGQYWTERIIAVGGKDINHIQLTTPWPSIGSGDIITGLSELAMNIIIRRKRSPIVIHCLTGIGRSGVMSVLMEIASELLPREGDPILLDVLQIASKLSEYRRNPLRDRLHLEFTYRAALKMARTILPAPVKEVKPVVEETTPEPTEIKDPLGDLDPLWKLKVS